MLRIFVHIQVFLKLWRYLIPIFILIFHVLTQNRSECYVPNSCKVKLFTQSFLTLCDPMDYSLQAPLFMEFSRQEFWSGLLFFLLQAIFLTQRSNPGLLHCRQILYCLSHQGSLSSFLSLFYVVVISICIFVGSFSSPSLC